MTAPPLPPAFLSMPLAHRGLHGSGAPENARAAFHAAIDAGYGIELDLQLSSDGEAMVFHDETLDRMTGMTGPIRDCTAAELEEAELPNGEGIPVLTEILSLVAGRVPLLIEIKDQHGALGPGAGTLEVATARALSAYDGPVAVMSFNPHAVAAFGAAAPHVPRGLTTCAFDEGDWPGVPEDALIDLRTMALYPIAGATFLSHDLRDLAAPKVVEMKAAGTPILCWTVRSEIEERGARHIADNITFEGYRPGLP